MKNILEARLLHMKKHWFSILFWLMLPLLASIGTTSLITTVQEDSKIPVGIVTKENSDITQELVNEISSTSFITISKLPEDVALYQLKKHELDSVFVIEEGFSSQVQAGKRNNIITSYQTKQSFAYTPVKELIISYVQQETGRSKTAFIIKELAASYQSDKGWTWEQIIAKSKEIQKDENLLNTSFSFTKVDQQSTETFRLWNIWGIWGVLSLLSTLLLFDWVVKEHQSPVLPRFAFMRVRFKSFLILSLLIYSVIMIILDAITMFVFQSIYNLEVNLSFLIGLLIYRFTLLLGGFLLSLLYNNIFRYYVVCFAISLFAMIGSGAILPTDGFTANLPWIQLINPLNPLLTGDILNFWPLFLLIAITIWYRRKERYHA